MASLWGRTALRISSPVSDQKFRAGGTSVQMIEQSYGQYIRKDFLGPLIAARPKTLGKAAVGEKTGP